MAMNTLLDFINDRFSADEGALILKSVRQDPLVWKFFNHDEAALQFLRSAEEKPGSFSPGSITKWVIESEYGLILGDLADPEYLLPETLKKEATKLFQTTLNTGIHPADLKSAGLLALELRERLKKDPCLDRIIDDLLLAHNHGSQHKNYLIWRTPFACLVQFFPGFQEFFNGIQTLNSPQSIIQLIPIVIHAFLTNPQQTDKHIDQLLSFLKNQDFRQQLESLKWIGNFNRPNIVRSLAIKLLQEKHTIRYIAQLFSEIERFETIHPEKDPLGRKLRHNLPEDLNQVAAINYYSGNKDKAAEIYEKSTQLLDFLKAQTQARALLSIEQKPQPQNWISVINSVPASIQAKWLFIQALINDGKEDEADNHLQELPDSPIKEILNSKIQKSLPAVTYQALKDENHLVKMFNKNNLDKFLDLVPPLSANFSNDLLEAFVTNEIEIKDFMWLEQILENNLNDATTVSLIRDLYTQNQQFKKAIDLTKLLSQVEPYDKSHQRKLAELYRNSRNWEDAFPIYQKIIQADERPSKEDLSHFAESALRTGQIDTALTICQNILQEEPKNENALVLLGEIYIAKGDMVKAIQHMEQVVELIPDQPEAWLSLASLWNKSSQHDREIEILNKALHVLPDEPVILHALGLAHLQGQKPSKSLKFFEKAFDLEPKNLQIKIDFAKAQVELGQYQDAWNLVKEHMDNYQSNASIAKLLGRILIALGQNIEAEPVLLSAAEQNPQDIDAVTLAADLILGRNEVKIDDPDRLILKRMEAVLNNAIKTTVDNQRLNQYIADINRLLGRHQQAFESYIQLAESGNSKSSNNNWQLLYGMGQSAIALDNTEIGLASLQEAASLQPENLSILHALVKAYQKAELDAKAKNLAQTALKIAPKDLDNILWYANFKYQINESDEAIAVLNDAYQLNPDNVSLKLQLAKSLITNGSTNEAESLLEDIIADQNTKVEELHQAAYLCVHLNRLNLAIDALEKTCERSTDFNPVEVMDLAVCYALLDQPQKALERLNCEQEQMIKYPQLALLKSDILSNLEQYHIAMDLLKSIEPDAETKLKDNVEDQVGESSPLLYPHDLSYQGYLYRLGQLSRISGDFSQSHLYLSSALEYDPENPKLINALLESYFACLAFDKAIALCETLSPVSIDPKAGYDQMDIACTKIETLIHLGQQDKAIELISRLDKKDNHYPRVKALQSILAFSLEDSAAAENNLEDAAQKYEANWNAVEANSVDMLFRQWAILQTIAESAVYIQDDRTAEAIYQIIHLKTDTQPIYNWRYALHLIRMAEKQQMAQVLSITTHAPGNSVFSKDRQHLALNLLKKAEPFLAPERLQCLKARLQSAFTGKWPLNAGVESCLNDPEEAAAYILGTSNNDLIQEIIEIFPEELHVLQAYGVYALNNNISDGINIIEKALQLDTKDPLNHVLYALLNEENPDAAYASMENALLLWPEELDWHVKAADLALQNGDNEAASRHIAFALEAYPENAKLWQKKAEIDLGKNELLEAKQAFEKSIQQENQESEVWIKLADVNRRLGNVPEAITSLRTAGEKAPDDMNITAQEVRLLIEQGNYQEAETRALQGLQKYPQNPDLIVAVSQTQSKQGKYELAQSSLDAAIKHDPDNLAFKLEQLKISKEQHGVEHELPKLIQLAQQYPEDSQVLTILTDWLIQSNQLEKAEETAKIVLRIMPEEAEIHLMLGRLHRKKGQLDQAVDNLSAAVAYDPYLVEAYIELGKTYQDRRDLKAAIAIYQKGTEARVTDPRPYYHAGMALKECKDYPGAEAMLRKAKQYSPEDPTIIRQLGMITAMNLISNLRETR